MAGVASGLLFLIPLLPEIELPVVPQLAGAEIPRDCFLVDLSRLGELYCKKAWALSLDELSAILAKAARDYDRSQRERGKSGFEVIGGKQRSNLTVFVFAGREAVWRHVQWLLKVCDEQGIHRIRFAVRVGKKDKSFDARLPATPPPATAVRIHIDPVKEEDRAMGPLQFRQFVQFPVSVRYHAGPRAVDNVGEIGRLFKRGTKAAVVRAGDNVPFHTVVDLMRELRKCGIDRVDFYAAVGPSKRTRRKPYLPFERPKAANPPAKK